MKSPHSLDHDGLDGILPNLKAAPSAPKYLIWIGLIFLLLVIILILFWVKKDKLVSDSILLTEAESSTHIKKKLATIKAEEIRPENNVLDELPLESISTLAKQQIKNSPIIKLHADSNTSSFSETKSIASPTLGYSIAKQVSSDKPVTTTNDKTNTHDKVVVANTLLTFQFKYSSSEVKVLSEKETNRLTNFVNKCDRVVIIGHTCNMGSAEFNYKLGLARAISMQKFLIGQGITSGILSTRSEGMEKPVASNATRFGRRLNRRIEMLCIIEPGNRSRLNKPL